MNTKQVTCGILYQYDTKFLIVHPTGNKFWSIPKGCKEDNETEKEAVIRELYEETNVIIPEEEYNKILDYGRAKYLKGKDLHLFYYNANKTYKNQKLLCHPSTDENRYSLYENDGFQFVTFQELLEKINLKQRISIEKLCMNTKSQFI